MIRTQRCELTALRPDDVESVVGLYVDRDVRRYLGGPRDGEATRAEFAALLEVDGTRRTWAIRSLTGGEFLGLVFLGPHHDGNDIEISYMLGPQFWRRGYASEAVGAVIDYALTELGLPRIIAETQAANVASCRLLERLGLTAERTLVRFGAEQVIYATVPAK